MEFEEE